MLETLILHAGLVTANPDEPARPINSGQTVYQIDSAALSLLRTYRSKQWDMRLREYQGDISWETEVWVAESPAHLIHFNGERFLGPIVQL